MEILKTYLPRDGIDFMLRPMDLEDRALFDLCVDSANIDIRESQGRDALFSTMVAATRQFWSDFDKDTGFLEGDHSPSFVAEADGVAYGVISCKFYMEGDAFAGSDYIHIVGPAHRGKGWYTPMRDLAFALQGILGGADSVCDYEVSQEAIQVRHLHTKEGRPLDGQQRHARGDVWHHARHTVGEMATGVTYQWETLSEEVVAPPVNFMEGLAHQP